MAKHCCGVKTVTLSKAADETISVSATGLKVDVQEFLEDLMRDYGNDIVITTTRTKQHLYTETRMARDSSNTFEKIEKSTIFKSLPKSIVKLHDSDIVRKTIISPTQRVDKDVHIRMTNDIYGADKATAWSISDILDTLDLKVSIPSVLDYSVYELTVQRGTPVIALLKSLFPIPGLMTLRSFYTTHVYFPENSQRYLTPMVVGVCRTETIGTQTIKYAHKVRGAAGEPRGVLTANLGLNTTITSKGTTMEYNLVGGVFFVHEEENETADITKYMSDMFNV